MDGSPRRNAQANRQARRQSPYNRPAAVAPTQSTPSRLRSVLSYLSPFKSGPKPAQAEPDDEPESDSLDETEPSAKEEDPDSAEEAAQFALHGRQLARESTGGIFGQALPASPTPGNHLRRNLGPSHLSSSFSMPDLASVASPRAPGNFARSPTAAASDYNASEYSAGGGAATEELARFFRVKAERGEEGLTAIEQAGVMHLLQQGELSLHLVKLHPVADAQSSFPAQSVPTAFTPNFASTNASTSLSFAPAASSASQVATSGAQYKRRRPLYVGAGYSSRRRKASSGISKSHSEGSLAALAAAETTGAVVDGKRRRTEQDEMEEDIPVASLDDVLVSAPIVSKPSAASPAASTSASEKAQDKLKSKPSISRFTGTTTPAKPSPLWQVSKADTPSPSPPRKPSARATTGAANLMLDVIHQVDAANPAPKPQVAPGKEAILNPYDNDANPLALASKRVPRSSGSGRSKPSNSRTAARAKSSVVEKPKEAEKEKEKQISPLEQLERTMPAEYRRDHTSKRTKASASEAPTAPAKKPKKPVEVVEILSSDGEEDQLEPDVEEVSARVSEAPVKQKSRNDEKKPFSFSSAPTPSFGQQKPTTTSNGFSFSAVPTQPVTSPNPSPSLDFGAGSAPTLSQSTPPRDRLSPSPSTLTPPQTERPSSPKASLPPTPPPVSTPFSFSIPPPSFVPHPPAASDGGNRVSSDSKISSKDRSASLPRSSLPVHEYDFAQIFASSTASSETNDASIKAVQDLVRNMGEGELPTFVF